MAYFDRFDIAEAHHLFARHYESGGDTPRRDIWRLSRMRFKPGLTLRTEDNPVKALTDNGLAIYHQLERQALGYEDS